MHSHLISIFRVLFIVLQLIVKSVCKDKDTKGNEVLFYHVHGRLRHNVTNYIITNRIDPKKTVQRLGIDT